MMVLQTGQLVDRRFRLAEQIGAGGMGVVFRAIDETTGTQVALKLLDGRTAEEIARARLEAESLARCSHPAIVRHVADGALADGGMYVAMEWLDGVTLAQQLLGDGVTLREAMVIARRVADALATAHRAGVLHRDIKPSNVLLVAGEPARATLIDFGVARVTDAVQVLTRTGAAIGTPGYMSPEQARGERTLTPAADVFGLGCVLYECATGHPAFSGSYPAAVLLKIVFTPAPPITALCPEAPPPLARLIHAMLAKDTAERPRDCAAVVAALDALPPVPDGPRRGMGGLVDAATVQSPPPELQCMVLAARGRTEDVLDPPSPEQIARLLELAERHAAKLDVLATGAVAAYLSGEPAQAARQAASLAIAWREVLAGWTIAISSPDGDGDSAAETVTTLVDNAVMTVLMRGNTPPIAVDPRTARLLEPEFTLDVARGREPWLIGRRT